MMTITDSEGVEQYGERALSNQNHSENIREFIYRFETLLNEYFQSEKPQTIGLPSVAYCAAELNLSPDYFGDLVKKDTGKTAREYIQSKLMDIAKAKIFDTSKTVSQIAFGLGFKYPQHFARLFKQRFGYSPLECRKLN